jgi:DNA mismatch endonuclease, patch repair protein
MESPEVRRRTMQAVKSKDTAVEMRVRRMLHAEGYRYRLHRRDLPGCPDLVFISRRKVVFINGCFWHGHHCPRGSRVPKTNRAYWTAKILNNRRRDAQHIRSLAAEGWRSLVVWECETKNLKVLSHKLKRFLEPKGSGGGLV